MQLGKGTDENAVCEMYCGYIANEVQSAVLKGKLSLVGANINAFTFHYEYETLCEAVC